VLKLCFTNVLNTVILTVTMYFLLYCDIVKYAGYLNSYCKALLQVQYRKNSMRVWEGDQYSTKQSRVLYWAQDSHQSAIFILHKHGGALTGLKHFWSTNSSLWLLLAIQKRDQWCCIFHTQ